MSKLKVSLVVFFVIWSAVATWIAVKSPKVSKIWKPIVSAQTLGELRAIAPPHDQVEKVIELLYTFSTHNRAEERGSSLETLLTDQLMGERRDEFLRSIDHMSRKGIQQTSKVKSIYWDRKISSVVANLEVIQTKNTGAKKVIYLESALHFVEVEGSGGEHHALLSKIDEKVLRDDRDDKIDRAFLSPGLPLVLDFPCPVKSVLPIDDPYGLEYQVSSDRSQVTLSATSELDNDSTFRIKCQKEYFQVRITSDSKLAMYRLLVSLPSGVNFKKKLTKDQLLIRDIEKQIGMRLESLERVE